MPANLDSADGLKLIMASMIHLDTILIKKNTVNMAAHILRLFIYILVHWSDMGSFAPGL